mmetsp:Transcript_9105/g.20727  ORF Transcript_9105/g.20727 Transcript_9105/m.20727 type:complete len:129 (-) Transcript_9105:97-483(-)
MHDGMDPILTANLKATNMAGSLGEGASKCEVNRDRRSFVRTELSRERKKRGKLFFLERMEVDVVNRRAFSQVCHLRQNPENRMALDRAVDRMRPSPESEGPRIVTHDRRLLYDGQDRKLNWAPLECCY